MPISRNTSSSGAPNRSASRLDRIPAITRTAPRRMAMLTESRDAMRAFAKHRKYLQLHPYRRHSSTPRPFLPKATPNPVYPHELACGVSSRWRQRDGYGILPNIRIRFARAGLPPNEF